MFDYQAGEKYKLTLIMVGIAGLLAGIFFTMLIMPTPEAPRARRAMTRASMDPDVVGYSAPPAVAHAINGGGFNSGPAPLIVDPMEARNLIEQWIPLAWDLSAGTVHSSQQQAMSLMTPECAQAYRQNIFTDALARQIEEAGLQSKFQAQDIKVGDLQADGSIVVTVSGIQTMSVPGKGGKSRQMKIEYLVKKFPDGMKIAGIT